MRKKRLSKELSVLTWGSVTEYEYHLRWGYLFIGDNLVPSRRKQFTKLSLVAGSQWSDNSPRLCSMQSSILSSSSAFLILTSNSKMRTETMNADNKDFSTFDYLNHTGDLINNVVPLSVTVVITVIYFSILSKLGSLLSCTITGGPKDFQCI